MAAEALVVILTKDVPVRRNVVLQVPIEGFFWTNPSVVRTESGYICSVKGVNYDREEVYYSGDWKALNSREPLTVKNVILHLDRDFNTTSLAPLDTSAVCENKRSNTVEDIRLFFMGDKLMAGGTLHKYALFPCGARWLSKIDAWRCFVAEVNNNCLVNDVVLNSVVEAKIEKNWVPWVHSPSELSLIANVSTGARMRLSDEQGRLVSRVISPAESFRWTDGWSGSSCVVPYSGGGVCIVHRRTTNMPYLYKHMLLVFDASMNVVRRSNVFSLEGVPVEFCCGLDVDESTDSAIIAYGRFDKSAVLIELSLANMLALVELPVDRSQSLSEVGVEESIPFSEAVKVILGHEGTIWGLLDELVIAQQRIDALSAAKAGK
jgi:hypothetical protein